MNHTEIINAIIHKFGYRSYLEIGVSSGKNFRSIDCALKVGVDPDPKSKATVHKTSDDFFATNQIEFDCIFIDGEHSHPQVCNDIMNARLNLSFGGTIIVHDLNPSTEFMQQVPRGLAKEWTGDGWKSWTELMSKVKDLEMFVVDTDYGVGIIRKGKRKLIERNYTLLYEYFVKNKKEWLNLISLEDFMRWLPNAKEVEMSH